MKFIKEKRQKGSFTVEASILIPILICVMAMAIHEGINMYVDIRDRTDKNKLWMVERFYVIQGVREVIDSGS